MGVLIESMDMPKSCGECPFFIDGYYLDCLLPNDGIDFGTVNDEGRAKGCPLVEVPEHGRLVDADKIRWMKMKAIAKCGDREENVTLAVLRVTDISELPTVIEAYEKKDEGH